MENQKSAIGLDGNLAAALGYPIGIIALILIFIEKDNKFVRFHAIQSLLWGLVMTIVAIVLAIVGTVVVFAAGAASSTLVWIFGILLTLIWFVWFAALIGGVIYAAVKAYGNNLTKLPLVGAFAEKWSS